MRALSDFPIHFESVLKRVLLLFLHVRLKCFNSFESCYENVIYLFSKASISTSYVAKYSSILLLIAIESVVYDLVSSLFIKQLTNAYPAFVRLYSHAV